MYCRTVLTRFAATRPTARESLARSRPCLLVLGAALLSATLGAVGCSSPGTDSGPPSDGASSANAGGSKNVGVGGGAGVGGARASSAQGSSSSGSASSTGPGQGTSSSGSASSTGPGQGGAGGAGSGSAAASGGSGPSSSAGSSGAGTAGTGGAFSGTSGAGGNGMAGAGGSTGTGGGGAAGSGGAGGGTAQGPCDIYASANTPCVAAHSTVRALYGAYGGSLYQVRRASDKTTKDVPVLAPGGFADTSVQDAFCKGTTCTVSLIYDQSANHNDLAKSPVAHWLPNGGNEANAADGKITVSGHTVHGIYVTGYSSNVAYRNNSTKGVAKGDQPEAMYMVVDGKRYSNQCCFDYGNAETSGNDDGNGTMESVYWGSDTTWGGQGSGNGPWIAADLENGMFKGDKGGWQTTAVTPSAKSIIASYATAMLKGPSGNHFTLKGGDAQSGTLTTMWDAARPSPGYSPKSLKGAIILGTGGDGSNGGTGTFFEGAMTSGNPSDATDDAIQANIVAAGYGH